MSTVALKVLLSRLGMDEQVGLIVVGQVRCRYFREEASADPGSGQQGDLVAEWGRLSYPARQKTQARPYARTIANSPGSTAAAA